MNGIIILLAVIAWAAWQVRQDAKQNNEKLSNRHQWWRTRERIK